MRTQLFIHSIYVWLTQNNEKLKKKTKIKFSYMRVFKMLCVLRLVEWQTVSLYHSWTKVAIFIFPCILNNIFSLSVLCIFISSKFYFVLFFTSAAAVSHVSPEAQFICIVYVIFSWKRKIVCIGCCMSGMYRICLFLSHTWYFNIIAIAVFWFQIVLVFMGTFFSLLD